MAKITDPSPIFGGFLFGLLLIILIVGFGFSGKHPTIVPEVQKAACIASQQVVKETSVGDLTSMDANVLQIAWWCSSFSRDPDVRFGSWILRHASRIGVALYLSLPSAIPVALLFWLLARFLKEEVLNTEPFLFGVGFAGAAGFFVLLALTGSEEALPFLRYMLSFDWT